MVTLTSRHVPVPNSDSQPDVAGRLSLSQQQRLAEAIASLAAACDGAQQRDGAGFDGQDTVAGRALAAIPVDQWTDQMFTFAAHCAGKYSGQLDHVGFNVANLWRIASLVPDDNGTLRAARDQIADDHHFRSRQVTVDAAGRLVIDFTYDPELVNQVRRLPGRRFDPGGKRWVCPASSAREVIAFAGEHGFHVDAKVYELAEETPQRAARTVTFDPDRQRLLIRFPKEHRLVQQVRSLPDRRWEPDLIAWVCPASSAVAVVEFADQHEFTVDHAVRELAANPPDKPKLAVQVFAVGKDRYAVVSEYDTRLVNACRDAGGKWVKHRNGWTVGALGLETVHTTLADTDRYAVDVCDATRPLWTVFDHGQQLAELSAALTHPPLDLPVGDQLRDFQYAVPAYARVQPRLIVGDEMGTGKTIEALAVAADNHRWPLAIVCPSIVTLNWRDEVRKWLPGRDCHVITTGKADLLADAAEVIIISYDLLHAHWDTLPQPQMVVFDESHFLKTPGRFLTEAELAQAREAEQVRADAEGRAPAHVKTYKGARRTAAAGELTGRLAPDVPVLALSGTPTKNARPAELASQLAVLGVLDWFGGKTGVRTLTKAGGDQISRKLRRTCMIRRTKQQVLPQLPAKTRRTVPVELPAAIASEYLDAEHQLLDYLADQARKAAAELGEDADAAAVEAKMRAEAAQHLIQIGVLRRITAKAKADAAVEWIDGFLDATDRPLATFAEHRHVTDMIAAKYHARTVVGGVSQDDRHESVRRFQNGQDRVICCSIRAAGVGITLTAASDLLMAEQSWTPADDEQAEDRTHRLGQHSSVTAHYLQATLDGKETIDGQIWRLVNDKRAEVARIVDGLPDNPDDMTDADRETARKAAETAAQSLAGDVVAELTRRAQTQ